MEKWLKQLQKMPWHDRARVNAALLELFARNFSALDRKKLKGHDQLFRIRVGIYRVIYKDNGKIITVITIPPKGDNTYNDL